MITFLIFRIMTDALIIIQHTFFKISMTAWPIASEMNINSERFRSQQYAHFDGNKNRISKMTVLAPDFYHPLLQKQKPLATIDCESEN